MSAGDHYYILPLSILHSGQSALQVLNQCISCGIVNAGLGHRQVHGETAFQALLAQAHADAQARGEAVKRQPNIQQELWDAALAGARLLGISGGSRAGDVQTHQQHTQTPRQVLFRMRHDWMWNAVYHARTLEGDTARPPDKPFTWREFRIIAAILSAKLNSHDFAFLGWESIQARACGYHTKALLQAAQTAGTLPAHCQPLTRDMIRHDLDKLESLGFFGRCRYSTGPCGGYTAYSFRHPRRTDLIAAVQQWAHVKASFKAKAAENRAEDLAAFRGMKAHAHSGGGSR